MLQGKLFVNIKTNSVVIKFYDYSNNSYRKMMKSHDFYKSRQTIITTDLIKLILSKVSFDNNYYIGGINFLECIEPDEHHKQIISELNKSNSEDKKILIQQLNQEITELSGEKGNDIKSIEVIYNTQPRIRLTLYSNGVIAADTKDDGIVSNFISDILDGVINEEN